MFTPPGIGFLHFHYTSPVPKAPLGRFGEQRKARMGAFLDVSRKTCDNSDGMYLWKGLVLMTLYDIEVKDRVGQEVPLSRYRGKVLLIVNTATGCGFTPQYAGLQDLYLKYQKDGLEILDFPCNQFAGQAPGTGEEIYSFCMGRFGITFPQFAKIEVNGRRTSPLYRFLKAKKGGLFRSHIPWNFTKFLIDRQGRVVKRFPPTTSPLRMEADIVALLSQTE
jgi:glutathione peroxidase